MGITWWLLNAGYAAYVVSPVFKDILRLRLMALVVSALFIAYGISSGIYPFVWWNLAFSVMHGYQIAMLIIERRGVALSDDDELVRATLFPTLDSIAFSALWELGVDELLQPNKLIVEAGQEIDEVLLVRDGAADVDLGEGRFIRLRPHSLIGEMSMLRGGPACATVRASGPTTVRRFSRAALLELGEERPAIKDAALLLIGRQLAEKIHADPSLVPA